MLSSIRRQAVCMILTCASITACGEGSDGPGETVSPLLFTGEVEAVPEADGHWVWGESAGEEFCQQWSLRGGQSGWFYGSASIASSNADVYVMPSMTDPRSISDASTFAYTSHAQFAEVGDTVFFRSARGRYGAWSIEAIDDQRRLFGTWYVPADGASDFTGEAVDTGMPSETRIRCPHPVLSGPIDITEAGGLWVWGEDDQQFCQHWSLAGTDAGVFHGTRFEQLSCVTVHVASGLRDPLSVADAKTFVFTLDAGRAQAGDTVFFRNPHGYVGAWTIEAIDERRHLIGTWYLQSDGSGDFTTGVIDTGQPLRIIPLE